MTVACNPWGVDSAKKNSRKRLGNWNSSATRPPSCLFLKLVSSTFRPFCCSHLMYDSFRSVTAKNGKTQTPARTGIFWLTSMDWVFYAMFTSLPWYQCPLPIGCFASARTSNQKVQFPMRKLKLTLHSNQVKGLSASRHATWFRHIFSAKFTVILLYNYLTSIKRQNLVPYTLKLCSRLT